MRSSPVVLFRTMYSEWRFRFIRDFLGTTRCWLFYFNRRKYPSRCNVSRTALGRIRWKLAFLDGRRPRNAWWINIGWDFARIRASMTKNGWFHSKHLSSVTSSLRASIKTETAPSGLVCRCYSCSSSIIQQNKSPMNLLPSSLANFECYDVCKPSTVHGLSKILGLSKALSRNPESRVAQLTKYVCIISSSLISSLSEWMDDYVHMREIRVSKLRIAIIPELTAVEYCIRGTEWLAVPNSIRYEVTIWLWRQSWI
jgi:hypothetical protein